mgnify:FL=1
MHSTIRGLDLMAITPLPTAPSRSSDPSTFADDADTWVAALATFTTEANALQTDVNAKQVLADASADAAALSEAAAELAEANAVAAASSAINSPATYATSTSSITPAIGTNAFTLAQTGKAFVVGQFVTVADATTPTTKFFNGAITAFNSGSGAITVTAIVVVGTSSGSNWVVTAAAPAQGENFVSPVQTFVALGNVSGSVAIDLRNGLACSMTITGNTTFTFTMPALFTTGKSTWWLAQITRSGSYSIGYPAGTEFHDGAAPTFAVGTLNELLITWDNGSSTGIGSRPRGNIA